MGKPISEETRSKISQALKAKGVRPSEKAFASLIDKQQKHWIVEFPDGHNEEVANLKAFARIHNLRYENLWKTAYGKLKSSGGFKVHAAEQTATVETGGGDVVS